jgi:hypothetical protein
MGVPRYLISVAVQRFGDAGLFTIREEMGKTVLRAEPRIGPARALQDPAREGVFRYRGGEGE